MDTDVTVRRVVTVAMQISIRDVADQITLVDVVASTHLETTIGRPIVSVGFRKHVAHEHGHTFVPGVAFQNDSTAVAVVELCLLDHPSARRVDRQSNRVVTGGAVRSEMVVSVAGAPVVVTVGLPVIERPLESSGGVVGAGISPCLRNEHGQHHRENDDALVEPGHGLPHLSCQRARLLLRELFCSLVKGLLIRPLRENKINLLHLTY